jgi:hypothetical protein
MKHVVAIHIRRNFLWEGARYCDGTFERTIQADTLDVAIDDLIAPFISAKLAEGTIVTLCLTIESK